MDGGCQRSHWRTALCHNDHAAPASRHTRETCACGHAACRVATSECCARTSEPKNQDTVLLRVSAARTPPNQG
eukprot:10792917-Alexandrium_andersonii.AAC.1